MDLWNAVEKDKVVQAARRAAAARNRTRMEPAQPPLKKVTIVGIMPAVHEAEVGVCTAATSEAASRSVCCLDEVGTASMDVARPKWLALEGSYVMGNITHLQIGLQGLLYQTLHSSHHFLLCLQH